MVTRMGPTQAIYICIQRDFEDKVQHLQEVALATTIRATGDQDMPR